MRMKNQLLVLMDFLACLAKVEAMRGANDCRARMHAPPMYQTKDFANCLNYIQTAENAIAGKGVADFLKRILNAKGHKN